MLKIGHRQGGDGSSDAAGGGVCGLSESLPGTRVNGSGEREEDVDEVLPVHTDGSLPGACIEGSITGSSAMAGWHAIKHPVRSSPCLGRPGWTGMGQRPPPMRS